MPVILFGLMRLVLELATNGEMKLLMEFKLVILNDYIFNFKIQCITVCLPN